MKKFPTRFLAITLGSLMTSTSAFAWFTNMNTPLVNDTPVVFEGVRGNASGNPDFGGQAWAMHGRWASFRTTKNKPVTITLETTTEGGSGSWAGVANPMHPALTVWKRPQGSKTYKVPPIGANPETTNTLKFADNSAAAGGYGFKEVVTTVDQRKAYIADHNFIPTNSFIMDDVQLDDGVMAGDVRMLHLRSAYDVDPWGATLRPIRYLNNHYGIHGVKDGVPGKLTITFTPDESTNYQVFIGGYRPEDGQNNKFDIKVTASGIR